MRNLLLMTNYMWRLSAPRRGWAFCMERCESCLIFAYYCRWTAILDNVVNTSCVKQLHSTFYPKGLVVFLSDVMKNSFRILVLFILSDKIIRILWNQESLGYVQITLTDVVSNKRINQKYHLIDSKNGQVQIELQWRTVE